MIPKFDPKELVVARETPASPYMPSVKIYSYPVSPKEGVKATMSRKPIWQTSGIESRYFIPRVYPDNVARAFSMESQPFDAVTEGGGKDIFGIEWEYIPQVGGSMVRPGEPFLSDANECYDKLVWPDIDAWDWEGSGKLNNDTFLATDSFVSCWFMNGWFERLISFMDFEGAIMALVDEDQQDAVKELFEKLSNLYIKILGKFIETYPAIDGFWIHGDWGSQKETFFSPAVAEEMIVPYMRKVTDFLHSKNRFCELHCCGQVLKQVPNMIAAGWDAWSGQPMNDTHKIHELYGDKMLIGVIPERFDPNTASEEEQRAFAKAYADKFCRPDRPSYLNTQGVDFLTPIYREELYIRSRENYSK